jgi:hypothetical protein
LSVSVTRSAFGETGDDEMTIDICAHGGLRQKREICKRGFEISELQDELQLQRLSLNNIREAEKKILIAEIEKNNKLRAELAAIASAMHAHPDSNLASLAETLYASDQAHGALQAERARLLKSILRLHCFCNQHVPIYSQTVLYDEARDVLDTEPKEEK